MRLKAYITALHAALFAILLAVSPAGSGSMMLLGAGKAGAAAPAYTGPGDIVSYTEWHGLRAYSAATRGTKAINLCDDLGANCTDIATDASTGALNGPGTHGTNNCATSNTCKIKIVYDQAGTHDLSQATVANMPVFVNSVTNSQPGMQFNGTGAAGQLLIGATTVTQAAPITLTAVYERLGNQGNFGGVIVAYEHPNGILLDSVINTTSLFAGSFADVTAADSAFHTVQGLISSSAGASSIYLDGTLTGSLSPGTGGFATDHIAIGGDNAGNRFLNGYILEAGWVGSDQTANNAAVCHNQRLFWGTSGSC